MRQIVLDTETTGLNAQGGDRVIEIGCVEMIDRRLSGEHIHFYINPERDIDAGAIAVHGLTVEFLADKPKFADIAEDLRAFVQGAELIIHNAPFDLGFLDAEFLRLGLSSFRSQAGKVIDTLIEARKRYPGKRNSLDALCERLEVSNAHRTLHGALLDAQLLAHVYLAMTRGQNNLAMDVLDQSSQAGQSVKKIDFSSLSLPVLYASELEQAAHEQLLDRLDAQLKGTSLWREAPASS
ncbi:MAG: DNA polymerase III subunit epsilon [Ottowia sp.]|nr:DNA polymerase III subunit epsilon [Ottowia sp.]